jgi:competence/damage-inducible protein CinA-like protein
MRAEVLSVGTELLLGDIVNTNAAYIGQSLAAIGIDCFMHTSVGDNEQRIADAIDGALARADAVIITGGLGPTQDDVTREAIAKVTGRALIRHSEIEERLRRRFAEFGRSMPEMNVRQADVPEGALIIEQSWGTAPGLIVERGAGVIYAVPGVPAEMEDMLARAVLPDLLQRSGEPSQIVSRVVRTAGVSESTIAEQLSGVWEILGGETTMAFLAGGGEVRIRLTAKAPDQARALELVAAAEASVRAALGVVVVGVDDETLEAVVGTLLLARGWSLGCAESLTGGALGSRITSSAGASEYFRGSIVSYAPEVKEELLGVPAWVLDEHGPVSEPVARAMAAGARDRLKADVAVALTGVAGPTEQGRPVGTVVIAVAGPLGEVVREVRLPGDRNTVRVLAVSSGLNLVRLYLLEAT